MQAPALSVIVGVTQVLEGAGGGRFKSYRPGHEPYHVRCSLRSKRDRAESMGPVMRMSLTETTEVVIAHPTDCMEHIGASTA